MNFIIKPTIDNVQRKFFWFWWGLFFFGFYWTLIFIRSFFTRNVSVYEWLNLSTNITVSDILAFIFIPLVMSIGYFHSKRKYKKEEPENE